MVRSKPWYEHLVDDQSMTMGKVFRMGDYQFPLRTGMDAAPKPPGTYRIYFFGDSFTYGLGLEDESKTFVHLAVQRLNERQPLKTTHQFEAFNGGMPASLTTHWLQLCDVTLERYEPDLVVAVFFLRNGLAGVTSIGQIDQIRDGMLALSRDSFLFRNSHLYRLFEERSAQVDLARTYLSAMRDGYLGDAPQTAQWQRAQADLIELKRRAERIGARFAVVIFPVLFELNYAYPLKDVCEEIERFCGAEGIPAHSLLPTFLGHNAEMLWISPYDQHPNVRGHEIAADGIYPFIEKLIRRVPMAPGDG